MPNLENIKGYANRITDLCKKSVPEGSSSSSELTRILGEWVTHSQELLQENIQLEHRLNQVSRELRQVQNSLSQYSDLNSDFVATCAHDLKSPINSILGFLDILSSDGEQMNRKDKQNMMTRMERTGRHMLVLIDDLLNVNQLESGKININPEPVLLSQLCQEALTSADGSLTTKEITAELQVSKGELRIRMDPQKGMQIISNLLANAIKFTSRGGKVYLTVITKGKQTSLIIRDTGQGIPAEELDNIFTRFSKGSTQATEGEKGTGLGLSIVKKLVELHKGTVEVSSQVGKGTIFTLNFPVAENSALLKLFSCKK